MMRTHTCGELTLKQKGKEVVLCGWVSRKRKHGSLVFLDLRDKYGVTQIVADEKDSAFEILNKISRESVISVKGKVSVRPSGTENSKIPTGEIEINVSDAQVLSSSDELPFEIESSNVGEDVRLKYRYLDLRKERMQKNLEIRSRAFASVCSFLTSAGYVNIDTPLFGKSTPEGSRDFLVPSRLQPGKFFALPQSPQQYKQILMVSGFDKYFQMAKCLRDEDLRSDRQFEFTQIDIEASFIEEEDLYSLTEKMLSQVFSDLGHKIKTPFLRMTYKDAMDKYGSDKPDLRYGLELLDISSLFSKTSFSIFKQTLDSKGCIKAITVPYEIPKKEQSRLLDIAKEKGAKGLVFMTLKGKEIDSNISKFLSDSEKNEIIKKLGLKENYTVCLVADNWKVSCESLGAVRVYLGKTEKKEGWKFLWVTEFPMFEFSKEFNRLQAAHHPFTMPKFSEISEITSKPLELSSYTYDIVLNGNELGGGSIRIHDSSVQLAVFSALGISKEKAEVQFSQLLKAFSYGVPPHGGIALGFDRLVMLLCGEESLKEVIAFPRNKSGINPMDESPSEVSSEQLKELHLKLDFEK